MHTSILNQHRPANIDVVEANKSCYLRCLVTKEILKLDRRIFSFHRDIQEWLRLTDRQYDFCAWLVGYFTTCLIQVELLRIVGDACKLDFHLDALL